MAIISESGTNEEGIELSCFNDGSFFVGDVKEMIDSNNRMVDEILNNATGVKNGIPELSLNKIKATLQRFGLKDATQPRDC